MSQTKPQVNGKSEIIQIEYILKFQEKSNV